MVALLGTRPFAAIAPRAAVRTWDWVCRHGRTPQGKVFDGGRLPWSEGVFDALDDPAVRKVVLMWGTRTGKTQIGLQWSAKVMDTAPLPGIFCTATETLLKRTMRNKFYPMLEFVQSTARQLLPKRLRGTREVRLSSCVWHCMWSGSPTILADTDGCYGWGNEIDKWDASTPVDGQSEQGDPLGLFFERFKEWSDHKILLECSPSLEGHSRIADEYAKSDQRRFYVGCPHCKARFVLRLGSENPDEGGIKFDKTSDGKLDADIARKTARYICHNKKCGKAIHNEHRPAMMRGGRWAPKGCHVDRDGKVCGKPERPNCTTAGFQLSSLYSLQLTWGDIAAAFVEARSKPALLQTFINGWVAETWKPYRAKSEPEEVAERLAVEESPGVIPSWATWRFDAVDVQEEYFKWLTIAVGPGERVAVVDRGMCDTWEEVYRDCVNKRIPHGDGKGDLLPALVAIDDGHKTPEVHAKCKAWSRSDRLVMPFKGANTDCGGEAFELKAIHLGVKGGSRTARRQALRSRGLIRVRHNPFFYEPIIQAMLDSGLPPDDGSLAIPGELAADGEFVREVCNGTQSDKPSKQTPDRYIWAKRWESEPNDFRDCLKMCLCGRDVKFRKNRRMVNARQLSVGSTPAASSPPAPVRAAAAEMRQSGLRGGHRRIRLQRRRVSR
ncbi:MAG: terminase gpA endonuclease subunit [Pirellulales bacterium]